MENSITKLWNKNFIIYITAFELSQIGNTLLWFAIPIYILMATNNPALLGTVMTLSFLQHVLFTPIGGAFADRFNKRYIIVLFNFLIAITIGLYIVLTGNFDMLFMTIVMLILITVLQALQSPSFETTVYYIVPMDKLIKANSVTWLLAIASGVFAPIVAGFMLSHLGLSSIIYASMFFYLAASILNNFLKIPFEKPEKSAGLVKSIINSLTDSFKFVWYEYKVMKRATIGLFLHALILFPILTTIPTVLINTVLGMNETRIGFSNGLIAVGGIFGVIILGRLGDKINVTKFTHLLVISSIILLLTIGAFMLTSNTWLAYAIITFGSLLINTVLVMFSLVYFTYLGQNTPEEMVGKIMAFAMAFMLLGGTLAQFAIGRFFNLFSNHLPLAVLILPVIVLIFSFATVIKEEKVG